MLSAQNRTILLATLFIMATGNLSLFRRLAEVYPLPGHPAFLLSLAIFFTLATLLLFLLVCHGRLTRWILAFFLLASSFAAYFMDQYGVVIDCGMIENMFQTDAREMRGLMSWELLFRVAVLGALPAWLMLRYAPKPNGLKTELIARGKLLLLTTALLVAAVAPFTADYASFIREHKTTRLFANPTYFSYSMFKFVQLKLKSAGDLPLQKTAADARRVETGTKKELIVLVVGETARADRFSLNGYGRETNPELKRRQVVSLNNVSSCGTSTGESVPCMFSVMKRRKFDREDALHMENALDVLFEHGVQVLWRDNNSDSKGVALRVQYEDFRSPNLNPVCDRECRDIGMLSGLDRYIANHRDHDLLIVLHQMGNHGPEYYRRYPAEFERYTPVCKSGELGDCSKQEIDNAYDNAILYTDYFLSAVIDFLKRYDDRYETAMLYVSDHGESLGEHGIYLHAAPYGIAPSEQTHIPVIVWMGRQFDYSLDQLAPYRDYPLSHDDLFCMLMVGYEIETKTCESRKQVLLENLDYRQADVK